jgi:hypothetical protein
MNNKKEPVKRTTGNPLTGPTTTATYQTVPSSIRLIAAKKGSNVKHRCDGFTVST